MAKIDNTLTLHTYISIALFNYSNRLEERKISYHIIETQL